MLSKNQTFLLFIIFSIITRLFSAIFYIEDIDSLRFALSLLEYDIVKLQPHFPGYPIFSFFAKCIYIISGSMGITFSLLGALSIYFIIYYSINILNLKINSTIGLFTASIIFLNPLMWLMSNRYMPDLMGLAFAIASFFYLINKKENLLDVCIGFFLFGLLAGIRLSYLPFLFIPIGYHLILNKKKSILILWLLMGLLIWLVPLVLLTGFSDLWIMAMEHTSGHFKDYGGTVYTDNNWVIRIVSFFRSIWADGLAGYWLNRSWITIIISGFLFYFTKQIVRNFKNIWNHNYSIKIIVYSIILYSIWILLFQNVIYKSRHILPVLLVFLMLLSLGQKYVTIEKIKIQNYINISFISFLFMVSLVLTLQHKKPTAIAQTKEYLINKKQPLTIITIPLINYYLRSAGVNTKFINVEKKDIVQQYLNSSLDNNSIMIGDFKDLLNKNISFNNDTIFYHNPYVNRMWSELEIFSLNKISDDR